MGKSQTAPMTAEQRWELNDPAVVEEDSRPWGHVTESAQTFWTPDGRVAELTQSRLLDNVVQLRSKLALLQGLPVDHSEQGGVNTRTKAEQIDVATARRRLDPADRGGGRESKGAAWCPEGVPRGMHPKTSHQFATARYGRSARGGRTRLSDDPHSTIINGESRLFVYPDRFPYTAVCKLYVSYLPDDTGSWKQTSEATGYLIGKSSLMTSGHVRPPNDRPWQIRVVPACWAGRSIFGAGMVTYVRQSFWWDADAGSDVQVCQLYDPIGARLGYFGFRGYDSDWEDLSVWTMAGFHYDRSLTSMSAEFDIAVRDDDDGDDITVDGSSYDTTQIESDANDASGASGSPLFAWWNGGPQAIGVHHGVERDGTLWGTDIYSCASGGDGFTQAAAWARRMWG